MCLILIAHRADPRFPLVVAANRDESQRRPAAPCGFWDDSPQILAGKDLEAGGSWLGISRPGRFAAVTNFWGRPPADDPSRPSRGELVPAFLRGTDPPLVHLQRIAREADRYAGFSLFAAAGDELAYLSNGEQRVPTPLAPGRYGLSNHLLETPWPKVVRGKQRLAAILASGRDSGETIGLLLALLSERAPVDGGLTVEQVSGDEARRRRAEASLFVPGRDYGTRCSTVLLVGVKGVALLAERSFGDDGRELGTRSFELAWPA